MGGLILQLHFGWFVGVIFMAVHLYFQTSKIREINRILSLKIFQSNKIAGAFLVLGSMSKFLNF